MQLLCADSKSGVETIFVSKDNKQEYIEIDDSVRQGDYKYTYSDNSATAVKSEQADLVVSAVERFAQVIPLNIQEIFLWYFEQKGVDNPERFLIQQTSAPLEGEVSEGQRGVNNLVNPSPLTPLPQDLEISETSSMQNNEPNERFLLGMIGKLLDKVGNKKSDLMDILTSLKTKKHTRKEK